MKSALRKKLSCHDSCLVDHPLAASRCEIVLKSSYAFFVDRYNVSGTWVL